ncbi:MULTISPECIES: hypothetical protein [unclassified Paraburkholderia]|uniref:hypothetical protein n=1 Tax=unclassified Paraburkholderia TaxID=2615204 RepID=UPI0016186BFE|nr:MULTISPECIES: hypothetical protein [unclassified Paraburkholderia]MBB5407635.1 hypothetical protein [Paraburkholderia sp. HC6.4b]MBB5452352.1 hypothetical protein [Paraburkholderia sp. Kb1A]
MAEATRLRLVRLDQSLNIVVSGRDGDALAQFRCIGSWFRIFLDLDVPSARGLSFFRRFVALGAAHQCANSWRRPSTCIGTVDSHVTGILRVLDAANRGHAIAKTIELELNCASKTRRSGTCRTPRNAADAQRRRPFL